MTSFTLNNKPFDEHQLNESSSLSDLLSSVQENTSDRSSIVTEIKLDDNIIDPRIHEIPKNISLSDFKHIEIITKTNLELVFEALESCTEYIDNLVSNINHLVSLYQNNDLENANIVFAEIIDGLDLYIQLITKIHSSLKKNFKEQVENAPILQELEIHLLSVIKALVPAKENNDIIMLSDLLEYELVDNLTKWKIQAIPLMKQMQN